MDDRPSALLAAGALMAVSGALAGWHGLGVSVYYASAALVVLLGLARALPVSLPRRPLLRDTDSSRQGGRSSRDTPQGGR